MDTTHKYCHLYISYTSLQVSSLPFFIAVSSISISNDLVMGFWKCHASLRRVALPICESSGVYAMVSPPFLSDLNSYRPTRVYAWLKLAR